LIHSNYARLLAGAAAGASALAFGADAAFADTANSGWSSSGSSSAVSDCPGVPANAPASTILVYFNGACVGAAVVARVLPSSTSTSSTSHGSTGAADTPAPYELVFQADNNQLPPSALKAWVETPVTQRAPADFKIQTSDTTGAAGAFFVPMTKTVTISTALLKDQKTGSAVVLPASTTGAPAPTGNLIELDLTYKERFTAEADSVDPCKDAQGVILYVNDTCAGVLESYRVEGASESDPTTFPANAAGVVDLVFAGALPDALKAWAAAGSGAVAASAKIDIIKKTTTTLVSAQGGVGTTDVPSLVIVLTGALPKAVTTGTKEQASETTLQLAFTSATSDSDGKKKKTDTSAGAGSGTGGSKGTSPWGN
jgi:hypothetical protein